MNERIDYQEHTENLVEVAESLGATVVRNSDGECMISMDSDMLVDFAKFVAEECVEAIVAHSEDVYSKGTREAITILEQQFGAE